MQIIRQSSGIVPKVSTLVELLRWRALNQADYLAYTFLEDGEDEALHISYGELDRRARAIAALLWQQDLQDARVLLLYPSGLDFIAAFFGCLYAGALAVPVFPPRLNRPSPRLQAIVKDSGAAAALTTGRILAKLERRFDHAPGLAAVRWLNTEKLAPGLEREWSELGTGSDSLAFLQYTSGSTSTPKGVKISHGNLIHNLEMIHEGFRIGTATGIFWLPNFHDMGLIGGVLEPMYCGAPSVLMSPAAFLQRPARWLQAITDFKGTISGAPNFAYQMCVDKITAQQRRSLDLSTWQTAFCGAETVRHETLTAFAETFGPYGFRNSSFYPCYGLAEGTLIASGGDGPALPVGRRFEATALQANRVVESNAADEGARTLISCGHALHGQKIVIVDPETAQPAGADEVGEIWLSGASVAQGYWGRPEETEATFRAYMGDSGDGPFLRTGDLGFIHKGELYIASRLRDLIIIRGRNHYPQDIEHTVESCHPALLPAAGAAFSVEVGGEERLVITYEVKRGHRHVDTEAVATAVRRAVAEQHELQLHALVLVKTLSIPKTSSGKVRRHLCRQQYLAGELDVVGEWHAATAPAAASQAEARKGQEATPAPAPVRPGAPAQTSGQPPTTSAIEAWLIDHISRQLNIEASTIDVRQPYIYYGLDSVQAVVLAGDLESWLGRPLPPTLAWDYPTIETLARYLAAATQPPAETTASPAGVAVALEPALLPEPQQASVEAIAVIGLGCRFPGAGSPAAFWELLHDGIDAIGEVPPQRFDVDALYDAALSRPGTINTRWGGFLEHIEQFDPYFFGISPREATYMDPQQRLLLEVAWEALEDAGQVQAELAGHSTGVFVGISTNDYSRLYNGDPAAIDLYAGTGNALSIAANRLSYLLDLRGPSLVIDTACSSSLVAVHLACQSLRHGECSLALAGGVSLILTPELTVSFSQAGMMAADGRCKTFDARADGYVRGEGCGVVVLKPLAAALADGDNIVAIIRGSAVNQDGRSNGLTAPNGQAQQAVIRQALANAQVAPAAIDYVETHGTGTPLGDPIEIHSLRAVMEQARPPQQTVVVGSVKTNIGHLEAAAGIAGLIKTILALQHEEMPPHLHYRELNPHIDLTSSPLVIGDRGRPWPRSDRPRLAGVSSFGFGGTNAHIVLQEAPPRLEAIESPARPDNVRLLPLSARSPEALAELAGAYEDLLAAEPASLPDIVYSASVHRDHHDYRLALTGRTAAEFQEQLQAFRHGQAHGGIASGWRLDNQRRGLVFVFSGQGSQWLGMGRQLLATEPVFRQSLAKTEQAMRQAAGVGWSLLAELEAEPDRSRLNEIGVLQPVLFAVQVALAALWRSWGIEPDAVVGQSMGEVAAAYVAGVLSLEEAAQVICRRSRLLQHLSGQGMMAVVGLPLDSARKFVNGFDTRVAVAGSMGPASTLLSGEPQAVQALVARLQSEDIFGRTVEVDVASHSPQVDGLLLEIRAILAHLAPRAAAIPFYSTVTARQEEGPGLGADYWARNLREPILIWPVLQQLLQEGHDIFVEVSPHPVLLSSIQQGADHLKQACTVLPSLRRHEADRDQMLSSLGRLYTLGRAVAWRALHPDGGRFVRLPLYPWQRERFWIDKVLAKYGAGKKLASNGRWAPIDNLAEWLYQVQWRPLAQGRQELPAGVAASKANNGTAAGAWLVLADQGGVGEALARRLAEQGMEPLLVFAGNDFRQLSGRRFQVNPARPEHLQQVVQASHTAISQAVHLWSLDAPNLAEAMASDVAAAAGLAAGSAVHLLQAVVGSGLEPPRLWLVTRGAQPVTATTGAPVVVSQAPLWGLGRSLALEHPTLWGGLVDLDPAAAAAENANFLWQEINGRADKTSSAREAAAPEDQVAWRRAERYVARLERPRPVEAPANQLRWRTNGSYLISGGLGDIGLQVARWLVAEGARRLILLGRAALPPRVEWQAVAGESRLGQQIKGVRELEAAGASVHLASVDVADEAQLAAFLESYRREGWPPIRGVVHAAGLVEVQSLLQLTAAELETVLRPKVAGGWALHRQFAGEALDFFLLFSSEAALLNSPLLSSYAAANAFLDGLAHYRRSLGLPAMSLNWGLWSDVGMGARIERELNHEIGSRGMQKLTSRQALAAVGQLLAQGWAQVAVFQVDWQEWARHHPEAGHRPLLDGLVGQGTASPATSAQNGLTRAELMAAAPEARRPLLSNYLGRQVAERTGLDPSRLDLRQPLDTLGIDSLMAIEVKNRVENDLGVIIPVTQFLQGPSVEQLAGWLMAALEANADAAPPAPLPTGAPAGGTGLDPERAQELMGRLDELSDSEVDALLADLVATSTDGANSGDIVREPEDE